MSKTELLKLDIILGSIFNFMLCCDKAEVRFRKIGLGKDCVLAVLANSFVARKHSLKRSRGLHKNIHWFHTKTSCNAVLNCGHWLSSLAVLI